LDEIRPQRGVFKAVDDAVAAATQAFRKFEPMSLEKRFEIVESMRQAALANAQHLAQMAVAETGLGRVEDKYTKNVAQARKTPGPEDLVPRIWTGDKGLTLVENAAFGVIASVTPTTNPGAPMINNSISMVSAGNAVVFNPHPSAKKICLRAIELL